MMLQFGIPELPEYLSVETCLIGRDVARLRNLEVSDLSSFQQVNQIGSNSNTPPIIQSPVPPQISYIGSAIKTYTETEMNTDGPNPMRDRNIQTEELKSISIGIQCNVEEDLEEAAFEKAQADDEVNIEEAKQRFMCFIRNNARRFENGKFECKLCGEIKAIGIRLAGHMSIHWGPPKLCARCGLEFEHAVLYKKHNCAFKRTIKRRQYIKCPHFSCGVNAISPAELYEHLNEHCGLRPHRCENCKLRFSTFGELRLHRKLHRKCSTIGEITKLYQLPKEDTLYRKRTFIIKTKNGRKILAKFFLSQLSKQHNKTTRYCCVCLKLCKNQLHYRKHHSRCLNQHKRRLKYKRDFAYQTKTTNGCKTTNGEVTS